MGHKHDYPDFSSIRSHLHRAQAQRHYDIGYALADALVDAGDFLRRGFAAIPSIVGVATSRRAKR